MQPEQHEFFEFLQRHPPFDQLPEESLQQAAATIDVVYFKAGTSILEFGDPVDALHIIRSGAVEVLRRSGELYNRLSEGGIFGEFGLLRAGKVRFPARALEDTLVYLLPDSEFHRLFEQHDHFADFVEVEDRTRLRQAVAQREDANDLLSAPVHTLLHRAPLVVTADTPAQAVALQMSAEVVSAALVVDSEDGRMQGIFTDRDIRDRLVCEGLPYRSPVGSIMTPNPLCIESGQLLFEAMLTMLKANIHHLPVMKKQKPIGVLELADVIRHESQNSLYLVNSIHRQQSVDELAALLPDVRACFRRMVNEDANSHMIGTALAVIGRSFKQRLLELAEEQLGPPPVPYCFLALGSMARDDQTLVTDQDNAMILDDRYDPALHEAYFSQLAAFVSDGLNLCGYPYCSGGIMATNPQWRKRLSEWRTTFTQWIEQPTPQFLLNSSVFFDLNGVWGELRWAEELYALVVSKARQTPRFLACMARNAIQRKPPLGFFKDFVMETDGRHSNSINIKRRATAPLNDLIRVHALAVGSTALNPFERLDDVIEAGIMPPGRGQDLRDALEFISMVRIRHQALDLDLDTEADNNVEPENLSEFERKHLKDAFRILSNAQKFLTYRYTPNRAG
ncbi:DUF294 nucleotidyltransferase-like domain-containing protein [Aestuariirhabdus litorea]|uniref:Cyclic nucleotide-binding/CBS domain-containing protein n=1 Tax=Aestuariirhabdus litorea TaxID=2528527 RepID=A0A3P3VKW3_9GAMM|nr:DUF294 nucleotidyltransferase-like domain-containing protein [Aestuariirhabdus litorea]RRJ83024.1 cyclic nucleotide-binding/CBS domain-containing protein [Aestuariirhabdus litorea]RWW93182.1 CBS domain-containing protein [Endozoicomonadaceae bacterium GTF-13]